MRRHLLLFIVLTLTLSSCAAPDPNPVLSQLYLEANGNDKEELLTEIQRQCGHFDDGSVPESCDPTRLDTPTLDAGTAGIEAVITDVPQESLPAVVNHYLTTAHSANPTITPVDLSPIHTSKSSDIDHIRAAFEREFYFRYSLGVARAFADDRQRSRIDDLYDVHERLLTVMTDSWGDAPELPTPAAAYTISPETAPYDTETTEAFLDELITNNSAGWRYDAETATTTEWRQLSLRSLAWVTT